MSLGPDPPLHFLVPIFPGFQLLDIAGPLDVLNYLSVLYPIGIDITLTLIASTLDPVPTKPTTPIDPTTNKPKYTLSGFPTNSDTNRINKTFNQHLIPDVTYTSYLSALQSGTIDAQSKHKPIDVLLIPGGVGTRMTRQTSNNETTSNIADLLSFIPQIHSRIRHSIITVCTGADVLAQTGLLTSRRATTNMLRFDTVSTRTPSVHWLRGRRYVRSLPSEAVPVNPATNLTESERHLSTKGEAIGPFQGEIWSSAGITAGIDVTLAFVAEYYGGVGVSRDLADKLEYEWREVPEGMVDAMYGLTEEGEDRVKSVGVVDQS